VRATEPDPTQLLANLRALDATAGIQHAPGTNTYRLKKSTAWTGPQITAAQNALETAPATTPQLDARTIVATWSIERRAEWLVLIDQINVIRQALSPPLAVITPAQAIAALNAKIDTLT